MYKNVGKKIKALAKIVCIIGIVLTVVCALIIIVLSFDAGDTELYFTGVIYLIIAPILWYIGSLTTYGFGELIDKVCDIERNTRKEEGVYKETIQN